MFCSIMAFAGTNEKESREWVLYANLILRENPMISQRTRLRWVWHAAAARLFWSTWHRVACSAAWLPCCCLLCCLAGGCPACPAALLLPCLAGCSACPAPLLHCWLAGHLNPVCQHTIHIRCCTNRYIGHVAQCAVCTVCFLSTERAWTYFNLLDVNNTIWHIFLPARLGERKKEKIWFHESQTLFCVFSLQIFPCSNHRVIEYSL